jgi:hypothetical protein
MRNKLILSALVAAFALIGGAQTAGAQSTCPAGQVGTPPYCTPEPPALQIVSTGTNNAGTASVTVRANKTGKLRVNGNSIKTINLNVDSVGNITITLHPRGRVLTALRNRGETRRKQIFLTLTPSDGSAPVTLKVVVRFVLKRS